MTNWTLNRYFLRTYLVSFLSAFVAIFALVYLVDIVEVARRSRFDDLGFGTMVLFSALRVPSFMGQALPFIVLFSSIYTLLQFNRRLELVVARAAGVSLWQILLPFVFGSLLLGLSATFLYNPVSAWTLRLADTVQGAETGGSGLSNAGTDVPWLRQQAEGVSSIINAKNVARQGNALGQVSAFIFDDAGQVVERVDAPNARLTEGAWILNRARITRIGYPPRTETTFRLPTSLRPEYVEQRLSDPEAISIWDLGSKIEVAASLGFNVMAFRMQWNTLVAQPALFIAMTLLAATVATRFSRSGQSGRMIAAGVMAGFVLYVITFLAKALGSNAVVPPVMAAWFPVLAAGLFGVTLLLHQEDG